MILVIIYYLSTLYFSRRSFWFSLCFCFFFILFCLSSIISFFFLSLQLFCPTFINLFLSFKRVLLRFNFHFSGLYFPYIFSIWLLYLQYPLICCLFFIVFVCFLIILGKLTVYENYFFVCILHCIFLYDSLSACSLFYFSLTYISIILFSLLSLFRLSFFLFWFHYYSLYSSYSSFYFFIDFSSVY